MVNGIIASLNYPLAHNTGVCHLQGPPLRYGCEAFQNHWKFDEKPFSPLDLLPPVFSSLLTRHIMTCFPQRFMQTDESMPSYSNMDLHRGCLYIEYLD